jgi:hypothetical protein
VSKLRHCQKQQNVSATARSSKQEVLMKLVQGQTISIQEEDILKEARFRRNI